MKAACPTQLSACLSCNHLVGLVFTACLYVSIAGWFPGGQSHSPESWRVGEKSNMFDNLPIHHNRPGNYNRYKLTLL